MNGADHYREAERLLALAEEVAVRTAEGSHAVAAQAQVHATLALAAATAEGQVCGEDDDAWHAAREWAEAIR